MTGEGLTLVLNGSVLFVDAMKAKVDAIFRLGNVLYPVRKIVM